jgi:predicted metalloprotease with PDZ domain
LTGGFETDYTYELGFDRERSLKDQRVRGLVPGSAAEKAGLREGDDLLGWQILVDTAKKTTLQVRRGNQARDIEYFPRAAGKKMLQFHPASRPAKP